MDDLHLAIEEDDIGAFQEFGVSVPETTETNAGRNDQSLETRMSDYDQPFREKGTSV